MKTDGLMLLLNLFCLELSLMISESTRLDAMFLIVEFTETGEIKREQQLRNKFINKIFEKSASCQIGIYM